MAVRWYIVHTYSGFENKIAAFVKEQAEKKGLSHLLEDVLVPTESVVSVRNGAKVSSERKFFPGYVLVKMEMTPETWHLVSSTPKVTGFLGGKKPVPMTQAEADRILHQIQEGVEKPKSVVSFEPGDQISVCDGPFASFSGVVEEVDAEKERLKVSVSIFGRQTPLDLNYTQVKKV